CRWGRCRAAVLREEAVRQLISGKDRTADQASASSQDTTVEGRDTDQAMAITRNTDTRNSAAASSPGPIHTISTTIACDTAAVTPRIMGTCTDLRTRSTDRSTTAITARITTASRVTISQATMQVIMHPMAHRVATAIGLGAGCHYRPMGRTATRR